MSSREKRSKTLHVRAGVLMRVLTVCLLVNVLGAGVRPQPAQAAAMQILDIDKGSIVITATGFTQGASQEEPYTGSYQITGTSTENTVSVRSGDHEITLSGLSITAPAGPATEGDQSSLYCAFDITEGSVGLTLVGDNVLTSSSGYAGIHVAPSSELSVSGNGVLDVAGGKGQPNSTSKFQYAGAAAIGGNGYKGESNFGTVSIETAQISAQGGDTAAHVNHGGGAGIGTGGFMSTDLVAPSGSVRIDSGTIEAYGGNAASMSETGGGAGIGCGGSPSVINYTSPFDVTINGGTIKAEGGNDAAGIGGGSNQNSGTIKIEGGNIEATGGTEVTSASFAAAGIGGGDNGWVSSISIGGDATVKAEATGAAAGVGSGANGASGARYTSGGVLTDDPGTIRVSGNATVVARGGATNRGRGGAGIGGGLNTYDYLTQTVGEITISGNARVDAVGGGSGAGIGGGTDGGILVLDREASTPDEPVYRAGEIAITENATVVARGGSAIGTGDRIMGGAGIGAGSSYLHNRTGGTVIVADTSDVTAYGGRRSQAIGVGSEYDFTLESALKSTLHVDATVALHLYDPEPLFEFSSHQNVPYTAYPEVVTGTGASDIVAFTSPNDPFPEAGAVVPTSSDDGFTWRYSKAADGYELEILDETGTVHSARAAAETFGNWAILLANEEPPEQTYTVTYHANGATGGTVPSDVAKYRTGGKATVLGNIGSLVRKGYDFIGWTLDEEGAGTVYKQGADILIGEANIDLYAKWEKQTPSAPEPEKPVPDPGKPSVRPTSGAGATPSKVTVISPGKESDDAPTGDSTDLSVLSVCALSSIAIAALLGRRKTEYRA